MRKVLVTGMSGTGKSTALTQLEKRGFQVADTDEPPWAIEERRLILSQLSEVEPLLR